MQDPAVPAYLQRRAAEAWFAKASAALEQAHSGPAVAAVPSEHPTSSQTSGRLPDGNKVLNEAEQGTHSPIHKSPKHEPKPYLGSKPPVSYPARCSGNGRRATVRDIMRALAEFSLQEEQIRVQYNEHFLPTAFWIDFHTQADQLAAMHGSPYLLGPRKIWIEAETMQVWKQGTYHPFAHNSRGRFVLVTGIQENATMGDIARHFAKYAVMPNGITFLRAAAKPRLDVGLPDNKENRARHRALVRMRHTEEAARAVRDLTNSFLLNQIVRLRTIS